MPKNDELLCRAKQKGTDEWVEGYYCKYERTNPDGSVNTTHMIVPYYASALYGIEIDFSTLGKCSGLTDKNGKKIFEGDVCTIAIPRIDGGVNKHENCNCEFDHASFWFESDDGFWCRGDGYGYDDTAQNNIEVIGNIHDNPEPLKYDGD